MVITFVKQTENMNFKFRPRLRPRLPCLTSLIFQESKTSTKRNIYFGVNTYLLGPRETVCFVVS